MGDISLWNWVIGTVLLALGGVSGYFTARLAKDQHTVELEKKLESAHNELSNFSHYQGDVNRHFLKTSLLLGKLTDNYREVYEHLATGAQKLCAETPDTPTLDLPNAGILPPVDTDEHEAEYPAVSSAQTIDTTAEPMDESVTENTSENVTEDSYESSDEKITESPEKPAEDMAESTTDSAESATMTDVPATEQLDAEEQLLPEKHDEGSPLDVESSVKLKSD